MKVYHHTHLANKSQAKRLTWEIFNAMEVRRKDYYINKLFHGADGFLPMPYLS